MPCETLASFLDGELPPDEADAFRAHLAGCTRCQRELHELMQLEALGLALGEETARSRPLPAMASTPGADASGARIIPLRPRRYRMLLAVPALLAAAAALLLWLRHEPDPAPRLALAVLPGLGPHRAIEGRLSHAGADRYRPYEVQRAAGTNAVEHIPLRDLAELEARGDLHGVAAGYLLNGIREQATHYLDMASQQPDMARNAASDRALLALLDGDPEAALDALDRVLEDAPRHPQAMWNRALALRELGLLMASAQAFEEIVSLNEPGWHEEARQQAEKLRALARERQERWTRVEEHGRTISDASAGLSPADVEAQPGLARQWFYDVVRMLEARERLEALRPVARSLDQRYGGTVLEAQLDRALQSDPARRGPLVRAYTELRSRAPHDPAVARSWLERVGRDADAADMLLGLMDFVDQRWNHLPLELAPEYRRLAGQAGDPWFALLAAEKEALAHVWQSDYAGAERVLTRALPACEAATGIEFRCIRIWSLLGHVYVGLHRPSDGRRHLTRAWQQARSTDDWMGEQRILKELVELTYRQDDSGTGSIATARAYLDELALRDPSCATRLYRHRLLAAMLAIQNRRAAARAELDHAASLLAGDSTCKEPRFSLQVALAEAMVLDPGRDAQQIAALQSQLEEFRGASADSPGGLAFADHIEGRLLVGRDRSAGHALLRQAIARADERPADDVAARKARSHSYMVLILDASSHGEHDRALSLIAEEQGIDVAARCALGIAVEHEVVVVARGADGSIAAATQPFGRQGIAAERVVPEHIRAALAGCEMVDVHARAPYFGSARLLPGDMAWRFRTRHAADEPPPALPPRRVIVTDVAPPAALGLPPLALHPAQPDAVMLRGAAATLTAVLRALADATEIEIHAHGVLDTTVADVAFLALSPDADGSYQLTAGDIRQQRLAGAPSVILGACHAAYTTRFFHDPSSLATAFMEAGARTVIASPAPIPDADATAVFAALRQRMVSGQPAAVALREMRVRAGGAAERGWLDEIVVFE